MKKSTIKLIAMLLTVVLMLPNFAGAGALNENEVDDGLLTWEEVEEITALEEPATKANEMLLAAWADENDVVILPNTFGGCFITDNYKLAVNLVQGDPILRREIEEIVGDPSVLTFINTDISFQGLREIQANLDQLLPGAEIIGSGISVATHKVNVRVSENTPIPYSCNPYINIEYSKPAQAQTSITYVPGNTISYKDGNLLKAAGTLGWYGSYSFSGDSGDESDCFITAGHVVDGFRLMDSDMLFNGDRAFSKDKYGKKSYCIYEAGSSEPNTAKDYAILSCDTTTNIINLTNDFQNDSSTIAITKSLGKSTSSTGDLSLIEGKTVYKAKGISSYRTARVTAIGVTRTLECGYYSRTFDSLVEVKSLWYNNPFSIRGDSGAPIYYKASGNTPTLVGLISGGNEAETSYFTPITVWRDLGFEPYLG